ncbi:hypothetical protein AMAG_10023 [Allomyces macrogynus ATCC 38327]|uniref:Chitin-binding type-4 domain-containing protein n=1 Tax=Allomyces macrogynus (strain ATCC 38327) TaxID=578462 RepID=A0A0L0SQL5_ALLM3|nr:hypothetical protein AMAG_10023 [Allomyces macrogynus ATCC 38327]|eukprot:KNE64669.1 hypothetical protein AMAG_10023 [Allomyces macrogynus ATCC 38327]
MTASTTRTTFSRLAVLAILALVLAPLVAHAHFSMVGSREAAEYHNNLKFYPIAGGANLRPVTNCLDLPAVTPKQLTPGEHTSIEFEVGNHASHVGNCKAALIDTNTGTEVASLDDVPNCVAKAHAYPLTVPDVECPHCVLKVSVAATHLSADQPEMYDSCLDVAIAGGKSGGGAQAAQAAEGGETEAKGLKDDAVAAQHAGEDHGAPAPVEEDHDAGADQGADDHSAVDEGDGYAPEDGNATDAHGTDVAAAHSAGTVSAQHAGEAHGVFDSDRAKADAAARDHSRGAAKADSGLTHVMDDGQMMAGPEMETFHAAGVDETKGAPEDQGDTADSALPKDMKATAQSVEEVRRQMLRFFKGKPPGASGAAAKSA